MKPLIATTAIVLSLFFVTGCRPSTTPETNAPATPATSAATITASPNPVPISGGSGATTVTWNIGDGSPGQVYVSEDGAAETLFATGGTGSAAAPWIRPGKTFEFRLYAGTEHAKLLAKTQVTAQK